MNAIQTNKLYDVEETTNRIKAEHYVTDSVISKDGTRIEYLQLGQGPGVVMLHGAMESARRHLTLAEGLADA